MMRRPNFVVESDEWPPPCACHSSLWASMCDLMNITRRRRNAATLVSMSDLDGQLVLVRHGQTEWSRAGRHTGRTDVPLTQQGENQARALAAALATRQLSHAFTSPAIRARHTAELAGFGDATVEPQLWEWDYGGYEGRTTSEIQQERPGWYLWTDGVEPGGQEHPGEAIVEVGARADGFLAKVQPLLAGGDVVIFAHGHMLRVVTARWLGLDATDGRLFKLGTGTLSTLGTEHDRPALSAWNVPA